MDLHGHLLSMITYVPMIANIYLRGNVLPIKTYVAMIARGRKKQTRGK